MQGRFIQQIDSLVLIRDVDEQNIAIYEKTMIITMVLAGLLGMANAQNTSNTEGHVQSATAISRVLGDGRKVETIVPPGLLHTVLKECKTGYLSSTSRTVLVV